MKPKYRFEATIAGVLFIVLFFVILLQIVGRVTPVPGPVWTEELARWIWVWMALIAIGSVERENAHLRMGFLVALMPRKAQWVVAVVTDIVYLGLAGHLVWIAYRTVVRTWNNESVSLPTTDALLYASALVAMILIVNRIVRRLVGWDPRAIASDREI